MRSKKVGGRAGGNQVWRSRKLLENWLYNIYTDTLKDQNGCWKWSCKYKPLREVFYVPRFSWLFSHFCAIARKRLLGVRTLRRGCCAHTVNPKCLTCIALTAGRKLYITGWFGGWDCFFSNSLNKCVKELKCDAFVFHQKCREITFFPLSCHQHIFFIHVTVGVIFL